MERVREALGYVALWLFVAFMGGLMLVASQAQGQAPCTGYDTTGDDFCQSFSTINPNNSDPAFGGFTGFFPCDAGSSIPIPFSPDLYYFLDRDCTATDDIVLRGPGGDLELGSLTLMDSTEATPDCGGDCSELQFTNYFILDSPEAFRWRLTWDSSKFPTAASYVTAGLMPRDKTLGSGSPASTTVNLWLDFAVEGGIQYAGQDKSPRYIHAAHAAPRSPADADTRRYFSWSQAPVTGADSTTGDTRLTQSPARCLIQASTVSLIDATTGAPYAVESGKVVRVGVRIDADGPGGAAGTDTELCTVGATSSTSNCEGLSTEVARGAWVARYWECPTCTDTATIILTDSLGCL